MNDRFTAVGIDPKDQGDIMKELLQIHVGKYGLSNKQNHLEKTAGFCKSIEEVAKKYNLTVAQVAMVGYDLGEFITISAIQDGEFNRLSPSNLDLL